jgi:hypothetical protein
MDPTSDFQKAMVEYLESVHIGEFMTGKMEEVKAKVDKNVAKNKEYQDPTQTLPIPPPPECPDKNCETCDNCKEMNKWQEQFEHTVDDLLLHSNVHECRTSVAADEKKQKKNVEAVLIKMDNARPDFLEKYLKKLK